MTKRERLILAHTPLVIQWATRYKATAANLGIEYEDLCQAGWLGFCQGYRRWNPRKGVTVGAFIGKWVWGAIHRICVPKKKLLPPAASLEAMEIPVCCNRLPHQEITDLNDWIACLPGTASRIAAKRLAAGDSPIAVRWQLGLSETQFRGLLLSLRHRWQADQSMGDR